MTFSKRWNPQPKAKQCAQCNKEDALPLRTDKLGKNCAKTIDEARAKLAKKHEADAK
jgi:hypothetical protein